MAIRLVRGAPGGDGSGGGSTPDSLAISSSVAPTAISVTGVHATAAISVGHGAGKILFGVGSSGHATKVLARSDDDARAGLIVQSHTATQTANPFSIVDHAGATLLAVGPTGQVAIPKDRLNLSPPLGTRSLVDDQGDLPSSDFGQVAARDSQRWLMESGTFAAPNTNTGPLVTIGKYENLTAAALGNALASDRNAVISVVSEGAVTNEVQTTAIAAQATNNSTVTAAGTCDDACALFGLARVQGSATGIAIGAYIEGKRNTATGGANGLEVRCANYTATDGVYNSTGMSRTVGIWLTAAGNNDSGAASVVGTFTGGMKWKVGYAAMAGAVVDQTFRDDTSAVTSIDINGSHTDAIDLSGASLTGFALKTAAGHRVLIGAASSGFSTTSFEVIRAGAADPFVAFRATDGSSIGVYYQNTAGSSNYFVAGGANNFLTGTAAGDTGIKPNTTAKKFHLGGTTSVISVTRENELGFFNIGTGVGKQTVTGYTSSPAEDSLLNALSQHGLITNSTTSTATPNVQTANYTPVLADAGKAIEMNVATANSVTIPPSTTTAFPIGTVMEIVQRGAGTTSLVAGSGVTLRSRGGLLTFAGQYAVVSLRKTATDEWIVAGDLV